MEKGIKSVQSSLSYSVGDRVILSEKPRYWSGATTKEDPYSKIKFPYEGVIDYLQEVYIPSYVTHTAATINGIPGFDLTCLVQEKKISHFKNVDQYPLLFN